MNMFIPTGLNQLDHESGAAPHSGGGDLVLALGSFTREILKAAGDRSNKSSRREESIAPSGSDVDFRKDRPTATFTGPSVIFDAQQEPPSVVVVSQHSSTLSAHSAARIDRYELDHLTLRFVDCPPSFESEFAVFLTLDRSVPFIASILEMLFILINGSAKFVQGSKVTSPNTALYASFAAAFVAPLVFYTIKRRHEKLVREYRKLSLMSEDDGDAPPAAVNNFAGTVPLFSFHDLYASNVPEARVSLRENTLHHEWASVLLYLFFALVEVAVRLEYRSCGLTMTPLDRRNSCVNTIGSQGAFMSFLVTNTAIFPVRFPLFVLYSVGLFGFLVGCRWLPGTIPPEVPTQVSSSITLLGVVLLFCIGTVYLQERISRRSFLSFAALLSAIDEASVIKKKVATIASSVSAFDLTAHINHSAMMPSSGGSTSRGALLMFSQETLVASIALSHMYDTALFAHIAPVDLAFLSHKLLCVYDVAKTRHMDSVLRSHHQQIHKASVSQEGDRYTVFVFLNTDDDDGPTNDRTPSSLSSLACVRRNVAISAVRFLSDALTAGNERKRALLRERSKHNRNIVKCVGFVGCGACAAAVAGPHDSLSRGGGSSVSLHVLYRGPAVDQMSVVAQSASEYLPQHPSSRDDTPNLIFMTRNAHSSISNLLEISSCSPSDAGAAHIPPVGLALNIQHWSKMSTTQEVPSTAPDVCHGTDVELSGRRCLVGLVCVPTPLDEAENTANPTVRSSTATPGQVKSHRTNRNNSLNPLATFVPKSSSLEAADLPSELTRNGDRSQESIGAFDRWRGVFPDPRVEEQYMRHTQSPLRRSQLLLLGVCTAVFAIVMMFISWQCSVDHFGLMFEQYVGVFAINITDPSSGANELIPTDLGVKYKMYPKDAFDVVSLRPHSPMFWFFFAAFCGLAICVAVAFSPPESKSELSDDQATPQPLALDGERTSITTRKIVISSLFLASIAFCVVGVFCAPVGTLLSNSSAVWVVAMGMLLLIRPPYLSMLLMMLAEAVLFLSFLIREIGFTDRSTQTKFLYLVQIPLAWSSFVLFRVLEDRNRRHRFFIFLETTAYQGRIKLQLAEMEQLLRSLAPDDIDAKEMVKRYHRVTERRLEEYARDGESTLVGQRRRDDASAAVSRSGASVVWNESDLAVNDDSGTPFLIRPEEYSFAVLSYNGAEPTTSKSGKGIEANLGVVYEVHRRLTDLASFARCHTRRQKESFYLSLWYSATRNEVLVVADSPFVVAWMVQSLCVQLSTAAVSQPAIAVTAVLGCANLCGTIAGSSSNGASAFEFMGESIRLARQLLTSFPHMQLPQQATSCSVFATERFARRVLNTSATLLDRLPRCTDEVVLGDQNTLLLMGLISGTVVNYASPLVVSQKTLHNCRDDEQQISPNPEQQPPNHVDSTDEGASRRVLLDELKLLADAMYFMCQDSAAADCSRPGDLRRALLQALTRMFCYHPVTFNHHDGELVENNLGCEGDNMWTPITFCIGGKRKKVAGCFLRVLTK